MLISLLNEFLFYLCQLNTVFLVCMLCMGLSVNVLFESLFPFVNYIFAFISGFLVHRIAALRFTPQLVRVMWMH